MSQIYAMDGRVVSAEKPIANIELVAMLRSMLADAEAGRLVVIAGVVGYTERGRLDLRFATHSNNWEVHDRLLARVGALRTMMENDLLDKLRVSETFEPRGPGDDAA